MGSLTQLGSVITALRQEYSDFGGVVGWEYYDAGTADGLANPWQWVKQIGSDLFGTLQTRLLPDGIHAADRPVSPFEAELADLLSKGVSFGDAVAALNKTSGDVQRIVSGACARSIVIMFSYQYSRCIKVQLQWTAVNTRFELHASH
jgi:hypothetical protein